jgi:hypothetical protein
VSTNKVSRQQLKALVKECLREILEEGLGRDSGHTVTQTESRRVNPPSRRHVPPVGRQVPQAVHQRMVPTDVVKMASAGNPILEGILADTAATTLQEQSHAERHGGHPTPAMMGIAEQVVNQATPEQLFGDASSDWMAILDKVGIHDRGGASG